METNTTNDAVREGAGADALRFYAAALEKEPNNIRLCAEIARCYMRLDNYKAAWTYAERALAIGVDEPNILYLCAGIAERRGDYENAITLYGKAIELTPDDAGFLLDRARLLSVINRYNESISDCDHILRLNPKSVGALEVKARVYETIGKMDEAKKELGKVLEIEPGNHHARYTLERLNEESSRHAERVKKQKRSFIVKPSERLTFSDVVGLESAKRELRRAIIHPLQNPELARQYGVRGGGGVLLYGPPGTGKTMLAKAVACEAKASIISLKISEVQSMWAGVAEKRIQKAFDEARANTPSILFVDEFDLLGGSRMGAERRWQRSIANTFLAELDGLTSANRNVLMLAATNMPWAVDPALKRPGRFGKQVYVPPPDAQQREALFRMYLRGKPLEDGIDYAKLAEKAAMCTGADISGICDTAAFDAYEAASEAGVQVKVGMSLLLRAIGSERRSLMEWFEAVRPIVGERGQKQLYPELAADIERFEQIRESGSSYYR